MKTECETEKMQFQASGPRKVEGHFDGGYFRSDGGVSLLREVEEKLDIVGCFSRCFSDYRDPSWVEHPLEGLIQQRVFGIAQGYEDLNDHDALRNDGMLALACGKSDPTGQDRRLERDRGKALAGKSTLNRLELGSAEGGPLHPYKKVILSPERVDDLLLELFCESQRKLDCAPKELIIDLDATDDPLHGEQEGRFFKAY